MLTIAVLWVIVKMARNTKTCNDSFYKHYHQKTYYLSNRLRNKGTSTRDYIEKNKFITRDEGASYFSLFTLSHVNVTSLHVPRTGDPNFS